MSIVPSVSAKKAPKWFWNIRIRSQKLNSLLNVFLMHIINAILCTKLALQLNWPFLRLSLSLSLILSISRFSHSIRFFSYSSIYLFALHCRKYVGETRNVAIDSLVITNMAWLFKESPVFISWAWNQWTPLPIKKRILRLWCQIQK